MEVQGQSGPIKEDLVIKHLALPALLITISIDPNSARICSTALWMPVPMRLHFVSDGG